MFDVFKLFSRLGGWEFPVKLESLFKDVSSKVSRQAGAELGQAQLKLGLGCTLIDIWSRQRG